MLGLPALLQKAQNFRGTLVYGGLFGGNVQKREQSFQGSGVGPILEVDAIGLALLTPVPGGVGHRKPRCLGHGAQAFDLLFTQEVQQ